MITAYGRDCKSKSNKSSSKSNHNRRNVRRKKTNKIDMEKKKQLTESDLEKGI